MFRAVDLQHRPMVAERVGLFWMLQFGGWTAFGLTMFGHALARERLAPAILDVAGLVLTGLALTSLFRRLYRRWRTRQVPPIGLALRIVGLCALGVPLWWEPQALVSRMVHQSQPAMVTWLPSYTKIPLDTWFEWGPILLGWSFLYFGINDWVSLQAERRRSAAAQASAQAARFRALQSQLQPHFLCNALNSVAALVLDGRGETAVAMISRVGEFLRVALRTSDELKVPLEMEAAFIRSYLEIEQLRFGDRLRAQIDIAPETRAALVPTMLLQPLVENAVRHGILPCVCGGIVSIQARAQGATLKLRVQDDGAGFGYHDAPAMGFGLSNAARRLEALYGNASALRIARGADRGVVIEIELPLQFAGRPADADPHTGRLRR